MQPAFCAFAPRVHRSSTFNIYLLLQVMSANLFKEFTLRQQNLEEGMGSFCNLLIKPVQRLPR